MSAPSTKQKLLSLVEDVEIVTKEMLELMCTPRAQRPEGLETAKLLELLVQKEKEVQDTLKTAQEQAELQKKLDGLKAEVAKRDADIRQLQKSLKEAETILASAIYQARQKLQSINQANKHRISSEELIKYAHKISSSNAVAAPPTWAHGDPRRPYPTDMDMRCGFLGRMNDLQINSQSTPGQHNLSDSLSAASRGGQLDHPSSSRPSSGTMSWQPSNDLGTLLGHHGPSHSTLDAKGHNKENEDVEIMSSDSSSSSSSDE